MLRVALDFLGAAVADAHGDSAAGGALAAGAGVPDVLARQRIFRRHDERLQRFIFLEIDRTAADSHRRARQARILKESSPGDAFRHRRAFLRKT
jgi:hypothetical protein